VRSLVRNPFRVSCCRLASQIQENLRFVRQMSIAYVYMNVLQLNLRVSSLSPEILETVTYKVKVKLSL
jgi:hypothetical protein